MCDELHAELESGQATARDLVQHLLRMNAASLTVPVIVADEKYEVSVKHVPVTPETTE